MSSDIEQTRSRFVTGAFAGIGEGPQNRLFVTLFLTEAEVGELLISADAVDTVERCCQRLAAGVITNRPRERLPLEEGQYAVMACVDRELGYAGLKSYAWTESGTPFVVVLFSLEEPTSLAAVIEADTLGRLRTGAASAVAARHLARTGAQTLGVIGCGRQSVTQIACIRAAVPSLSRVSAFCRDPEKLARFCAENDCVPAGSHQEIAGNDIVVTVTTSADPVVRGEWLQPGALVCAVGANDPARRELDNVVLERAAFVCCDSREQSRLEAGDLIEPIEADVLDWLEVHELQDVVSGDVPGRATDTDIVVFKSNGIAAWDVAAGARVVELARERGVGTIL